MVPPRLLLLAAAIVVCAATAPQAANAGDPHVDGHAHSRNPYAHAYAGSVPWHDPNWSDSVHLHHYWKPLYYAHHTREHGALGIHKGREWVWLDGQHHGYPFWKSPPLPRSAGPTYTWGEWGPRRSFYYPYTPGGQGEIPYGFSPEPY